MTLFADDQRRGGGDLRDRPLDHARDHLLGLQARAAARSASTPPGARSPAARTASRSPATTCRAASFLGIAGLIYLYGFDGFLYSIGFLVAFLTVMFLLAERMRNAGKYTIADVLSFRLNETPARAAAALGTFAVVTFYLIAQMVGAGVLIQALVGIDFSLAVILTGVFMLCYVIFGGMVATTWVQIIKAVLLMAGILVMSIFVLGKVGFNPIELFNRADANKGAESTFSLGPGTYLPKPLDTVSLGLALVLGTAGLPHILMRFFTVPNAKAARSSVVWAMFIIGFFYLLTTFIGFGARAFLGEGGVEAAGKGGNLAAPNLAAFLGGGEGTFGGDLFLAVIAGVAFATILAVVAGLVLSASSGVLARHLVLDRPQAQGLRARGGHGRADRRVRDRRDRDHHRRHRRLGPERLVHGRPRVRGGGERELPGAAARADVAALQHHRRDHRRACSASSSAIFLVIVSPKVWPGADTVTGSPIGWELSNPGIISIPLGFLGCFLGTMLSREQQGRAHVRRAVRALGDRASAPSGALEKVA